jgi:hypothetical protein
LENYLGIAAFLKRRVNNSVDNISESEMIDLAKDLIRATAAATPYVGNTPIQLATLRPKGLINIEQPEFPTQEISLQIGGSFHYYHGFVFDQGSSFEWGGSVYTFCKIKGNRTPIPLGDNHFYGNTLISATFIYKGGFVSFAKNITRNCKLIIAPGIDEKQLIPILRYFKYIERPIKL